MFMANTVTFLKNYIKFAWEVRLITAKIFITKFQQSNDDSEKKVMMLRIVEELISSTEDLAMWIAATEARQRPTKKYRDVWEYLLQIEATDDQIVHILNDAARARTANGLARKLNLAPLSQLTVAAKMSEQDLIGIITELLKAVKAARHNRTAARKLLLRFHNKVKHGMMVQDYNGELYVRDLRTKINKSTNRITRKNRNVYLALDFERAKKMVGTIEANCYAVRGLASLLMYDFINQLINRKRKKLTDKQKRFWEEALNSS
jgi:hypothetical protein